MAKDMKQYGPWLLLIGGLVHLVPQLDSWLTNLAGGTSWVQIIVGALSVIVALLSFKK
jgi:hypothetical protein